MSILFRVMSILFRVYINGVLFFTLVARLQVDFPGMFTQCNSIGKTVHYLIAIPI